MIWSPLFDGVVGLLIKAVNGLIAALAAALSAFFAALPDMPELPEPPGAIETASSWVAWFFPVGALVDVLAFVLSMWLLWQAVALALRWAKAIQ